MAVRLRVFTVLGAFLIGAALVVLAGPVSSEEASVRAERVSFGNERTFAAGDRPQSVVSSRFDGDRKKDIATANLGENTVSVLFNQGGGNFATPGIYKVKVGKAPLGIVAGDFNGDHKKDLATANINSDNVSVLINRRDGRFREARNFRVGNGPVALTAADVDRDGKDDLATANSISGKVTVLLNKGGGDFRQAKSYDVGKYPQGIVAGHFDGNRKPDLAVTGGGSDDVSVLINEGKGAFKKATSFRAGNEPYSITRVDFDRDGDKDLAVAVNSNRSFGNNGVAVLLGNGKGGFGRPTTYTIEGGLVASGITKADFNGDGKLDIAAISVNSFEFSIFRGTGKGGLGAAQSFKLQIGEPTGIVASDFNNDRRPDIGLGKIGPAKSRYSSTPRRADKLQMVSG